MRRIQAAGAVILTVIAKLARGMTTEEVARKYELLMVRSREMRPYVQREGDPRI
jgi:hypothetical protein